MAFQENCLAETPDDPVWEPAFEARDLNASVRLGGRMVEISGYVCGPAGAPVVVAMGGIPPIASQRIMTARKAGGGIRPGRGGRSIRIASAC